MANPLPNDLADTIWWATFTIELPQAAPAPLNPSSVPNGFGGCFTLSMISSGMTEKWWLLLNVQANEIQKYVDSHQSADFSGFKQIFSN